MLKLRPEHLDALRPVTRAQFPERVLRSTFEEGEKARRDPRTGDVVLTDTRGYESRLSFYDDGLPSRLTHASGSSESYEHDEQGRLAAVVYSSGDRVELERDGQGNITKIDRPGLLEYRLEHDSSDRLTSAQYPDGKKITLDYHPSGGLARYTDRTGAVTRYCRDESGTLETVIDPLGRETRYITDDEGRLGAVVFPDGTEEGYVHDSEENVVRVTRRDGSRVVQRLDSNGALASIDWAGEEREFEFDGDDLVKAAAHGDEISADYDPAGNLLAEKTSRGETRYEHDAAGHPIRLTYPTGTTVEYEYDEDDRPCCARAWGKQVRIAYDPAGRSLEVRYDHSLTERQEFAAVGRQALVVVRNARGQTLSEQTYDYDANERLTGIIDRWGTQPNQRRARRFEYDGESRLLRELGPDGHRPIVEYAYDAKGNLTSAGGQPIEIGMIDEPLKLGSTRITYDGLGNVTSLPGPRGEMRCRFSGGGQLEEVQVGGTTWRYEYDALGRRIRKSNGEETWEYFWSGHQLVAEELKAGPDAEMLRREYLYFPDSVTPIAFRENGRVYWMQSDVRGAIFRVFDEAGKEVWRATYDSFGAAQVAVGDIRQPWRMAGHYEDSETGLFYNFARYYSPLTRSYLSRDPNWYKPEASNYGYALNDPWNRADPNGALAPLIILGAVGVVALGAAVGAGIAKLTGGDPVAGAIDGAATTAGGLIGGALVAATGGGALLIAGGAALGGGIFGFGGDLINQSISEQGQEGDGLCLTCAAKVGAWSTAIDLLTFGIASKIPPLKQFLKGVGDDIIEQAQKALKHLSPAPPRNLATKPNQAFFWSGRTNGIGGEDIAREIAEQNGGVTLEKILKERGIELPEWDPTNPATIDAWKQASKEYAAGASGEVRAVIGDNLRPGSVWEEVELPALMDNPNVTKITTIDPETGVETVIFER